MKESTEIRLKTYSEEIKKLHEKFLGYPENLNIQYNELLNEFGLFSTCINNVGDPFTESTYKIDSREFEKEVISFFSELYKLEDYWGYVTSCGTEGNLAGIRLGREIYPDGIFYYSKESHYSIAKASKFFRLEEIIIESQENGEIDYRDFESKLDPSKPVIINANIGTTMKGAIDDIDKLEEILFNKGITKYYIHCDMALTGMMLPYLVDAPTISFEKNIGSISISGHKFIGSPFPSGIFITPKNLAEKTESYVEYLDTLDNTIMGSRSGLAPIFLWYAIQEKGHDGFKDEVNKCMLNAQYLYNKLQDINYPSWINKFSNIVYFKKPSDEIIQEWQLAKNEDIAHIVTMQHVTADKLNLFLESLKKDNS
jgi:histidine decarboxylase